MIKAKGRSKIERYREVLWQELIIEVRFSSVSHFKRELRKFDRKYNYWRKNQTLGYQTPDEFLEQWEMINK